jgi:catechol 2,3-dioxygenase-like lactoylglutathione lyase family enzyme
VGRCAAVVGLVISQLTSSPVAPDRVPRSVPRRHGGVSYHPLVPTIRYLVADVDEAVEFYVERLGFTLSARMGPPFAIVERQGLELWLSGPQTSAAKPMPDGSVPEPGGWNRLVLEVDDVVELARELRAAGVLCRNEPLTGPGGTQVLIEDPSGNPVELISPRG